MRFDPRRTQALVSGNAVAVIHDSISQSSSEDYMGPSAMVPPGAGARVRV